MIGSLNWKRRLLLPCLLLLGCWLPGVSYGQNRVHIGVGFNLSYAALDSLNYILNAYNAENAWTVENPMREIHMPLGLTAHLGGDFAGILVDLQYTMRSASTRARGPVSPGSPETQEILVRYNASTADVGMGIFFLRKPRLRMAVGQSVDFGNLRIGGKRGPSNQLAGQVLSRYVNELNFGTTTFLQLMMAFQDGVGPGIFIRPYFQFSVRKNDYSPLNRAIRPVESLADPLFILGRQSNAGIKMGVFFGS
jgi:hypothetical protein